MTAPVVGTLIAGKYRVERVLGQGGMGVVVVAMHDELDQRVAIKFLLPEAVRDAEWVARFSREAKAAAKIKSEHVVRVFDVGKLPDGAPYMVMEFLDGKDLQSILHDRMKLPVSEALDYVLQACEALAEAHAAGIVHRDLKPANLFLAHRSDGSPCIKVLDFGISKVTGPGDVSVTNTQAIVGSPLYMSPEQMKASKNVDKRSDIWSLGIILQELVTGHPSFVASTSAELCALVLTAQPTPIRESLSTAPPELEAIIARCLQKNPDARYANVGELARDLLPLAPNGATSVERITRLSNTGANAAARASVPAISRVVVSHDGSSDELSTTEATIPATNLSPQAVVATSSPSLSSADHVAATQLSAGTPIAPVAPPVAATNAAWGAPAKPPAGSRTMLFAGLAVVGVLGLGGAAVALSHRDPTPSTSATSAATSAPEHTSTTVGTETSTAGAGTAIATASTPPAIPLSALPTSTATGHATVAHPTVTSSAATVKPAAAASTKPVASASSKPATVNTSGFGGRN